MNMRYDMRMIRDYEPVTGLVVFDEKPAPLIPAGTKKVVDQVSILRW